MQAPLSKAILTAAAILILVVPGQARITRLVVEHTEALGHDGYGRLSGQAYGELDPKLPLNAIITDLEFAPRNARGLVEYAATFTILKPADMAKASGVLLYFVPNRGHVNLTGGGFLADARKQGHVLVASGWQGDIAAGRWCRVTVGPGRQKPGWLQHHRPGARPIQRYACGRNHLADSVAAAWQEPPIRPAWIPPKPR